METFLGPTNPLLFGGTCGIGQQMWLSDKKEDKECYSIDSPTEFEKKNRAKANLSNKKLVWCHYRTQLYKLTHTYTSAKCVWPTLPIYQKSTLWNIIASKSTLHFKMIVFLNFSNRWSDLRVSWKIIAIIAEDSKVENLIGLKQLENNTLF